MIHKMRERPENFQLNTDSWLSRGLVFAGLGQFGGSKSALYKDSSFYQNEGVLTNMQPATDWIWDSQLDRWALTFSANGDYLAFGDGITAPASISSPRLTVAAWCKTDNYTDAFNGTIARGRGFDSYSGLSWELGWVNNAAYFGVSDSVDGVHKSGNASIGNNSWHHWAGRFSGTRVEIWKDGVEASAYDWTGEIDYSKTFNYFRVGWGYTGTTYCLDGQLSDILIFNRSCSAPEIAALADPSNVDLSVGGVPLILPQWRRVYGMVGTNPLTLTEDTFENTSPYEQDEAVGTVGATGGTEPYSFEIVSQTLL